MDIELPTPIRTFVDATNAGDTAAFLAAFATDAVLDDWGRVFEGRERIGEWNQTDNIGKQSHFDVVSATSGTQPDTVTVVLAVSGNGYNGTGPMTFRLRDGLISSVTIA